MIFAWLADGVVVLHAVFILFVVCVGVLVFWRQGFAWLHLPCMVWGILSAIFGWLCPLTDLENHWRNLAGAQGYEGGYIENYLLPLIYPPGLTPTVQLVMGLGLLALNGVIYGFVWRFWRARS